jgi:hypothetical protein
VTTRRRLPLPRPSTARPSGPLTDAIRADNGALAEHSAAQIASNLNSKNAAANLGVANIAMGEATVAATGNATAMRNVTQESNAWIQGLANQGVIAQKSADGLKGVNQSLLENGGTYEDVQGKVAQYNESLASMHPELQKQLQALLNGTGALGEQAKAAREAYNGYLLQEQGLTGLTEAQIKARDATTEHTKAIYDQQNASLGYRGAVQSTKEAMDGYNAAMKDGKIAGDEDTRALLALENAMSPAGAGRLQRRLRELNGDHGVRQTGRGDARPEPRGGQPREQLHRAAAGQPRPDHREDERHRGAGGRADHRHRQHR